MSTLCSRLSAKLVTFLHLKTKFHRSKFKKRKRQNSIGYKFQCGSCNATYYGKTKRHFKVRICEHLGISALPGKRVKGDDDSAIKEHLLFCNHTPDFEDLLPITGTLKLR